MLFDLIYNDDGVYGTGTAKVMIGIHLKRNVLRYFVVATTGQLTKILISISKKCNAKNYLSSVWRPAAELLKTRLRPTHSFLGSTP